MKRGDSIGDWELGPPLGAGGMGIVWRATHRGNGVVAVVKTLSDDRLSGPEARELANRLRREAKVLSKLDHPFVVRALETIEAEERIFLVLELVEGKTLETWLADSPSPSRSVLLLRRVLEALAYAHSLGVVHRDLKPANVMVGEGDLPRLLDFGLARALDSTRLTQTGMVLGTIAYMAPEQARGGPVDHRADLFAVGMMLAQVLGCREPFRASDSMAIYRRTISDLPLELDPWLPADLRRLLESLLEKNPERRLGSATEALDRFESLVAEMGGLDERILLAQQSVASSRPDPPRLPRHERSELSVIEELLVGLGSGRGGNLLILAPPGFGRTTALLDISSRLAGAGLAVESLPFAEGGLSGMIPWDFVRRRAGESPSEETVDLHSASAAVGRFLGLVKGEAAKGSFAILLDDLQNGSPEDFGWVDSLLRISQEEPLLVIAAGDSSPEGAPDGSREAYASFLSRTAAAGTFQRLFLPPIPEGALLELLERTGLPGESANRIAALAGGSPGLVNLLLERWHSGRTIATVVEDGPPPLVRRLRRRWTHLEKIAKEAVRIVVDAGGDVEIGRIAQQTGQGKLAVAGRLRDLEKKHGWIRVDPSGRAFLTQPFLGAIKERELGEE